MQYPIQTPHDDIIWKKNIQREITATNPINYNPTYKTKENNPSHATKEVTLEPSRLRNLPEDPSYEILS